MHLIGLDIGFSMSRRTTALAELQNGELRVDKLSVSERDARLAEVTDVDVVAIDAPLVPTGCPADMPRRVEQLLSRGAFQKRCKPGASHVPGTGQLLRQHGTTAATIVAAAARWQSEPPFPTIWQGSGVIEAFPNAFLGVALPDATYAGAQQVIRGKKFDWLYDHWIRLDLFSRAVLSCGLPLELTTTLHAERDHQRRAALICLLTAAFAATGQAVAVGNTETGYFFLPAAPLWAEWSKQALSGLH